MGRVALITGATGGLGKVLLAHLIMDPEIETVFATTRNEQTVRHDKVQWLKLDYLSPDSIYKAVADVKNRTEQLDTLISASGYLHGTTGHPEKNLSSIRLDALESSYRINTTGPLSMFSALCPLFKRSERAVIAFLSAQLGSIEDNNSGGWYGYRMAKAALNMSIKTASIEVERWKNKPVIVAIHPGTTYTDLSKPFVKHRKEQVRSAKASGDLIYHLIGSLGPEQNGAFLRATGETLPW